LGTLIAVLKEMTVMHSTKIKTRVKYTLADQTTPIGLYLKIRDRYHNAVLLESTDFRSRENCFSYIGIQSISSFELKNNTVHLTISDYEKQFNPNQGEVPDIMNEYLGGFQVEGDTDPSIFNGLFGFTAYDGVRYFDTMKLNAEKTTHSIPDLRYDLYKFVVALDHHKDQMIILENTFEDEESEIDSFSQELLEGLAGVFSFTREGQEESNLTDEEYKEMVTIGKQHCQVGDVFQIVLSRKFSQGFKGDDFNVYRALRTINPSPYLFYFDHGNYKIFGSSPEAQLVIKNGVASINPIAGTYKRTGNDVEDEAKAAALSKDKKEIAEHIMLVDLARNDLSKHTNEVKVNQFKEVQFFSHVIHLVSNVQGRLNGISNPFRIFADTFPAGTLAGAPKYKAIELIDQYEKQRRGFYGGAIGLIDFNGNLNHAIVIRSFLSQGNTLHYQAGAGIVAVSDEESELQEVNNKLRALKNALEEAEKI